MRRTHFVRDSELGWGRSDPDSGTINFFDSPTTNEVTLPSAGRTYRAAVLPPQERAWWFDGDRWRVGRIDSPRTSEAEAYFIHFPNGFTEVVPSSEIRVRWSVPLADALDLLKAGTVETRFFHERRTNFLRSVTDQRSASLGLGGLLSSAVEIHDHQVGAARRVLSDPIPRYLLADEVGLGKTIEAGMVLRQMLLDTAGNAIVIAPDHILGQWKQELATKFRVHQLAGTVEVIGHSQIDRIRPDSRLLTIVDEAHRFTDRVDYDGEGVRERQYNALRAIAHASKALLLLSATPVRSNEDAFLGLLHLLDPLNYPLADLDSFRQRVEMRDDLAQAMSAVNDETPLRYLDEPLVLISALVHDDPIVERLISHARRCIAASHPNEARSLVSRLRIHLSETYRLHRRMIRNRRSTAVKRHFPVRGRELASTWLLPDPDRRREDLFTILEALRLDLEITEHPSAGPILQVILGRILAPLVALEDVVLALRGKTGHDLSADELAATADLGTTDVGRGLADDLERLLARSVEVDRISLMTKWAQQRVGRGKYAVACTFPTTARFAAQALTYELGRHRVTALLESQSDAERTRLAGEFARSSEKCVLVIDRSAEEGTNLQFIEEVLHLNVPTLTSHLEQRLGRFDRWSELPRPVRSVTFGESEPARQDHLGAWTTTLTELFGVFTSSTSTLQYVLSDLEAEFFRTAVKQGFAGARDGMLAQADDLEMQKKRIAAQDLLDSIEDRADDEDLARRLTGIDAQQRAIEKAVHGYVSEMLQFSAWYDDDRVRFGVNKSNPPLLTEKSVRDIGTHLFEQAYTADRIAAAEGQGFLRWGEPLVNALARLAEIDDRGKAFAVEVQRQAREPDREPWVAFCFDVNIAPGPAHPSDGRNVDEAFHRAVQARIALFLETTVERIWWMAGRGECPRRMTDDLERSEGVNLGSRLERFHELTAPLNWARVCDEAYLGALAKVRERDRVVSRLAEARERAANAQRRESAIQNARSRIDGEAVIDRRAMAAVDAAIANPVFTLESCGAVVITWAYRP
jgi:ATP-dependent helicase HepA